MNHKALCIVSAVALISFAGLAGLGFRSGEVETSQRVETVRESAAGTTTYTVDPVHSNVIFKIRHGTVTNFYGRFNQVDGAIEFDEDAEIISSMSFKIPVSSVDTNSRTRDGHIKGAEFFNFRQYPGMTFESTSINPNGEGSYILKGTLSLHGVTKEIEATLDQVRTGIFRDRDVLGFEARFTIMRSDYGIMKYLADDLSETGPLGNRVDLIVAIESGI